MTSPIALSPDPLDGLDAGRRARFAAVAGHLIPAAHGMPSAADVVGDGRLRFVLTARPDLAEPLRAALRPELGDDPAARLGTLERDEPGQHAALIQAVVFGYYTDRDVRDRLRYPGQEAIQLYSWKVPEYVDEGLIDAVLARGPVWRDPATGRRAEAKPEASWSVRLPAEAPGAPEAAPMRDASPERPGGAPDRTGASASDHPEPAPH